MSATAPLVVKREVLYDQDSICPLCARHIASVEEAEFDHIIPRYLWPRQPDGTPVEGLNSKENLQAIHRDPCHVVKTRALDWPNPVYPWQRAAVLGFLAHDPQDPHSYLVQAPMGSGKSRYLFSAFEMWRLRYPTTSADRRPLLICLAPRKDILSGLGEKAIERGLSVQGRNLAAHERIVQANGRLVEIDAASVQPADDCDVYLMTYQAMSGAGSLAALMRRRPTLIGADEIHRAEDESRWGDDLDFFLRRAAAKTAMSATPFRTRARRIHSLRYHEDGAREGVVDPHYEYPWSRARQDGVVCHTEFIAFDAEGSWAVTRNGELVSRGAGPISSRSRRGARRSLGASLDDPEFQDRLLEEGAICLRYVWQTWHSDARRIVVCKSIRMATEVCDRLNAREPGSAVRVTSMDQDGNPDANAHRTLQAFKNQTIPAHTLVVVDKACEGFDDPNIKVIVYLTNKLTRVRAYQTWGRGMRDVGVADIECYVIMPANPDLVDYAAELLTYQGEPTEGEEEEEDEEESGEGEGERDLFETLSEGVRDIHAESVIRDESISEIHAEAERVAAIFHAPVSLVSGILTEGQVPSGTTPPAAAPEPASPPSAERDGQERARYKREVNRVAKRVAQQLTGGFQQVGLVHAQARVHANLPSPSEKPLGSLSVPEMQRLVGDLDDVTARHAGALYRVQREGLRDFS